jgi:hypothetical protein
MLLNISITVTSEQDIVISSFPIIVIVGSGNNVLSVCMNELFAVADFVSISESGDKLSDVSNMSSAPCEDDATDEKPPGGVAEIRSLLPVVNNSSVLKTLFGVSPFLDDTPTPPVDTVDVSTNEAHGDVATMLPVETSSSLPVIKVTFPSIVETSISVIAVTHVVSLLSSETSFVVELVVPDSEGK